MLKSGAGGDFLKPALQMREHRLVDAFDAKPAPGIGADGDIGKGEFAFKKASRRKPGINDAPLYGFCVGRFLNRRHVALLYRRSDQRPKDRTIGGLQRG